MKYGNIIIFGASSGIGLATAEYLDGSCKKIITVSRRPSAIGEWIKADLTKKNDIEELSIKLKDITIDALLYLGGTWEENAFTPDYNFETCSDMDIENVLNVNLLAPIRVIQHLLPNLKKSSNAKIVIMGAALDSLDQIPYKEVANSASKYGLKGTVASLRQTLKDYRIGISLINPGYVATPEVIRDFNSIGESLDHTIPMNDIFTTIEFILSLSNRTNVNEIDLPGMT